MVKDLRVDIDVDQAFVPGVRHGYAIPSYKTKRGGAAPGAQDKGCRGPCSECGRPTLPWGSQARCYENQVPLAPALLEPGTSPSSPVGGELLQSCDELQKSSFAWLKAHAQEHQDHRCTLPGFITHLGSLVLNQTHSHSDQGPCLQARHSQSGSSPSSTPSNPGGSFTPPFTPRSGGLTEAVESTPSPLGCHGRDVILMTPVAFHC